MSNCRPSHSRVLATFLCNCDSKCICFYLLVATMSCSEAKGEDCSWKVNADSRFTH